MSATLKQIFNNLQGEWKFKRIISNILENSLEKAEGEAAFSKDKSTAKKHMDNFKQNFTELKNPKIEKDVKNIKQIARDMEKKLTSAELITVRKNSTPPLMKKKNGRGR